REALLWKGFSFVDIISDCIELNGRRLGFKTAHQMFKWFDERFHIVEGVRDHLKDDELGIAKREADVEVEVKVEVRAEGKPEVLVEDLKLFTLEELKHFDGSEGRPVYIGYKRKVYDISTSPLFQGEKRMRCHIAGKDLTRDIEFAPHGEDLVFKFPVVGKLLTIPSPGGRG
ncbi:MAG: cytochrome b5 domain-containing protein, partial [Deltaproteobacteria bacterium]|nr:cytochrome b5 domain-containing protein [Deltaproteobacteria bacterium]